MKQRHWLDFTEHTLLFGTGLGTAAAVLLQNALYTLAPLSLLVALGVLNRHRLAQSTLHQSQHAAASVQDSLANRLDSVEQLVQDSPSFEAFNQFQQAVLNKNDAVLSRFSQRSDDLQQQINRCLWELESLDLTDLRQDTHQLQEQYQQLGHSIDDLAAQIHHLPAAARLEHVEAAITDLQMGMMRVRVGLETVHHEAHKSIDPLQDQIDALNLQIKQLSRSTDNSILRQEVAELIKAVTDLVPKRDFIALTYTLEELQRQHADLQDAIANLNEALHSATQDSHAVSDQQQAQIDWVTTLQEDIYQLQTQLDELTRYVQRGAEHSIVQTVMQQVVAQLPTTLDVAALQQQFQVLAARVEEAEIELLNTKQQFHGAETLGQHQLVFDLPGSASTPSASSSQLLLDTAIQQAQHHLTLVWPWSDQMALDARLLNQIEALLQRHVRVDFGWCHQGDRREGRFITPIQQRWSTYPHHHQDLQAVLQQLVPLKQRYPHHFKFKVLGTDENFLVCDRDFAVVGLQTLLTQTTVFPVLGLKLRTKDETVIQRLIQRFQQSHIDPEDRVAFFNRAITRHDLSDYAGALADYTQVLHLHRQDDVAYNNRGLVHYDMGKVQSALQDISQAIHLQPDSFIPRCNRAVLYLEQQHFAAAIADLDVALMKNNQSSIAWFYRGISHQKQGDWLLALSDFSQSLEQDSTAAFVYCYRSAVYRKLNQISNAIADLEQAAQRLLEQEDVPNYQRVCCALSKLKGSDAPAYLEATPPRPLSSQWRSSRNESEAQSRRVL